MTEEKIKQEVLESKELENFRNIRVETTEEYKKTRFNFDLDSLLKQVIDLTIKKCKARIINLLSL